MMCPKIMPMKWTDFTKAIDDIFDSRTHFYKCFADFRLQLSDDKKKDTGKKLVKMVSFFFNTW